MALALTRVIRILSRRYPQADTVTTVTTDTLTLPAPKRRFFPAAGRSYSPPGRKVRRPWW